MGLLRLLSNVHVMGQDARVTPMAWKTLHAFYQDTRIQFAAEPAGLRDAWRDFSQHHYTGPNFWTDTYLRHSLHVQALGRT